MGRARLGSITNRLLHTFQRRYRTSVAQPEEVDRRTVSLTQAPFVSRKLAWSFAIVGSQVQFLSGAVFSTMSLIGRSAPTARPDHCNNTPSMRFGQDQRPTPSLNTYIPHVAPGVWSICLR